MSKVSVKEEPDCELGSVSGGARADITSPNIDQVHIKKEPEYAENARNTVLVKQEPWRSLYTDHVVKDELVVGPEHLQRPHVDIGVSSAPAFTTRPNFTRERDEGHSKQVFNDCFVRLVRVRNLDESHVNNHKTPTYSIKKKNKDKNLHIKKDSRTDNDRKLKCDVCSEIFVLKSELIQHLMMHIHTPLNLNQEDGEHEASELQGGWTRSGRNVETTDCFVRLERLPLANYNKHRAFKLVSVSSEPQGGRTRSADLQRTLGNCSVRIERLSLRALLAYNKHREQSKLSVLEKYTTCSASTGRQPEPTSVSHALHKPLRQKINTNSSEHTADIFVCDTCGKGYEQKRFIISHIKKHLRKKLRNIVGKTYQCQVCKKEFTQSSSLTLHKRVHTGEKPYKCKICKKAFRQLAHLKKHELIHSGLKPFCCEICKKKFSGADYLKKHRRTHTGEKPYLCQICRKRFSRLSHLKLHKLLHTGEKPYSCDICKKAFRQASALKIHKLIHTGERPFVCEVCKKTYTQWSHLQIHKRDHTGEKPYACEICQRRFKDSSTLKMHRQTHTSDKPYTCEVCKKKFRRADGLKVHQITHSGEKPYKCETCSKRFAYASSLTMHLLTHKKNHTSVKYVQKSLPRLVLQKHNRLHPEDPLNKIT